MNWFVCMESTKTGKEFRIPATDNGRVTDAVASAECDRIVESLSKNKRWTNLHVEAY